MTNLKLKVTLLNQSYIDVKKMPSLWPHSGHVSSSCEAYIVSTRPHFVLCFLFKSLTRGGSCLSLVCLSPHIVQDSLIGRLTLTVTDEL